MNCGAVERVLHEYVDGELDAAAHAAVTRHVTGCESCAELVEDLRVVRQLIRSCAVRYSGSQAFRAALARPPRLERWRRRVVTAGAAAFALVSAPRLAALAFCLVLAGAVGLHVAPGIRDAGMPAEVVASHVRAMLSDRMVELAVEEVQAAQPWLRQRLRFAPSIADAADELRLVGARTDYIRHQAAGALVYSAGRHYVTVFVWPARVGAHAPQPAGRLRGFNLVNWVAGGLFYCAVSDMDGDRLYHLARRLDVRQ